MSVHQAQSVVAMCALSRSVPALARYGTTASRSVHYTCLVSQAAALSFSPRVFKEPAPSIPVSHTFQLTLSDQASEMAIRFIEIPRTKASKAHIGGSILDLPGEIRTMIYVDLFEPKENIRFLCSEDKKTGIQDEDMKSSSCVPVNTAAFASIRDGINLLRSCRQIYDEAASVLYSNNTFVFGMTPDGHTKRFAQIKAVAKGFGQIQSAAIWCSGSQMQYVRKVTIDVANGCSESACLEHYPWFENVNIAPLVKAMWSPLAAKVDFEFVQSDAGLGERDDNPYFVQRQLFDIKTVNTVLEYLRADTDDFKKYSRQILSVLTKPFMYHPSHPSHCWSIPGYVVLGRHGSHRDAQQHLPLWPGRGKGKPSPTKRWYYSNLLYLPESVRKQIYRYVTISKRAASADFSMDQNPNVYPGIFPVKDFVAVDTL